jgi:hypothetical protein
LSGEHPLKELVDQPELVADANGQIEVDPTKMQLKAKVFAGLPTYDGSRSNGSALGMLYLAGVDTYEIASSFLTAAFNRCWAEALNRRGERGVTHFLLLHADIVPLEMNWVQQLWQEFNANKCKVLSAIVPIKTVHGVTSTALEVEGDKWHPRRITMQEAHKLPVTWSHPNLLVNTGMLMVDFREPWVEKICFDVSNRIRLQDGKYVVDCEPEDWHFARQCHKLGVPVHCTRRVRVNHQGGGSWTNSKPWGIETDHQATTPLDLEQLQKEMTCPVPEQ